MSTSLPGRWGKALTLHLAILLCFASPLVAQPPAYYQGVDFTLSGEALRNQLASLIANTHAVYVPYTPGVWDALRFTDRDPQNPTKVLLLYGFNDNDGQVITDRTRHRDSSCHGPGCAGLWVREHVYPRSLGTPALSLENTGSDLHALRAIDDQRNGMRANLPFAQGQGNSRVTNSGGFYPGDEWKGDVARMMMYMHLRYPAQCPAQRVGQGGASFSTFDQMPDIFLVWNAEDPPSPYEHTRNNHFQTVQGNRNPFIDNPGLATRIWGGPQALDAWLTTSTADDPDAPAPFRVYPTVTRDLLYIQTEEARFTWTLHSFSGQLVQSGQHTTAIDLSAYPSGGYVLTLQGASGNLVAKVWRL